MNIGKYVHDFLYLLNLDARGRLLRKMPKKAICAEIGVWKGDFSKRIISVTRPSCLHLIDPWAFQPEFAERMYGGKVAKSKNDMDFIYQDVYNKFSDYRNVKIHREMSGDALKTFDDDYFDWVYIDGNHYYDYVLSDLLISYMKVKRGGFIAGDDYNWKDGDSTPVSNAVQHFIETNNISFDDMTLIGGQFIIKI